jgi:hypothetical protein
VFRLSNVASASRSWKEHPVAQLRGRRQQTTRPREHPEQAGVLPLLAGGRERIEGRLPWPRESL